MIVRTGYASRNGGVPHAIVNPVPPGATEATARCGVVLKMLNGEREFDIPGYADCRTCRTLMRRDDGEAISKGFGAKSKVDTPQREKEDWDAAEKRYLSTHGEGQVESRVAPAPRRSGDADFVLRDRVAPVRAVVTAIFHASCPCGWEGSMSRVQVNARGQAAKHNRENHRD